MKTETPGDAQRTLNYAVVALVGMLAGIVIGCALSSSRSSAMGDPVAQVPHPRSLESHP